MRQKKCLNNYAKMEPISLLDQKVSKMKRDIMAIGTGTYYRRVQPMARIMAEFYVSHFGQLRVIVDGCDHVVKDTR
jgi:hypothetical protein